MEQPPYFHSFNSGLFRVYQYTHYLVELGAQKVMGQEKLSRLGSGSISQISNPHQIQPSYGRFKMACLALRR